MFYREFCELFMGIYLKEHLPYTFCITFTGLWSLADVLQNRCFYEFYDMYRRTSVLESLFNKIAGLRTCNFIKKRLQHRCFLENIAKFLRTAILKNVSGGCFFTMKTFPTDLHLRYQKLILETDDGIYFMSKVYSYKDIHMQLFRGHSCFTEFHRLEDF